MVKIKKAAILLSHAKAAPRALPFAATFRPFAAIGLKLTLLLM